MPTCDITGYDIITCDSMDREPIDDKVQFTYRPNYETEPLE